VLTFFFGTLYGPTVSFQQAQSQPEQEEDAQAPESESAPTVLPQLLHIQPPGSNSAPQLASTFFGTPYKPTVSSQQAQSKQEEDAQGTNWIC
jgi:hypothetical protein